MIGFTHFFQLRTEAKVIATTAGSKKSSWTPRAKRHGERFETPTAYWTNMGLMEA